MHIRLIEEKDIRAILNIYNYYIANTTVTFETEELNFAQFRQRVHEVTSFYPWIVLEEDTKIIGYAYLSAFNTRSAYQWSADLSLYLDDQCKGKGYGTQLYQEIEKLAINQGFTNIISLITSSNEASLVFHKKHGFTECGYLPTVGYKKEWLAVTFCIKKIQNESEHPVPILPFQY